MNKIETLFMEALRASLQNRKITWDDGISQEDFQKIFTLADTHKIFPMIYSAVDSCEGFQKTEPSFAEKQKRKMIHLVVQQTRKTQEFLEIHQYLKNQGIKNVVVKGIVCRNIYPNPDYRLSGDEDILVSAEEFFHCQEVLKEYGMQQKNPDSMGESHECSFGMQGSPIHIEVHQSLFAADSKLFAPWNAYFATCMEKTLEIDIQGVQVTVPDVTDHLFYLICHAMKHFLHSGFGIRQLCDIIMFANIYGKEIRWDKLQKQCREIHGEKFVGSLFQLGEQELVFSREQAGFPRDWIETQETFEDLLQEILQSGIYGQMSHSRKHSSNITLNAAESEKRNGTVKPILETAFPSAKKLEYRYKYLKKYPILLPIAWTDRVLKYLKELRNTTENNAADSVRIGRERIELLRKYGILPQKEKK